MAVYPGISGSSGTTERNLSKALLNTSTEQLFIFLISGGIILKSWEPFTERLEYLIFFISADA